MDTISLVIEKEDPLKRIAPHYEQTPLESYLLKIGDYRNIFFGTIMLKNDIIELIEAEKVSNMIELVS